MEFERTATIGMGADAAFARLSDPLRIPDYVPLVTHVGSDAEDGGPGEGEDATADTAAGPTDAEHPDSLAEARFFADAGARRVEWGLPGAPYAGTMAIEPVTASLSRLTLRLTTRDDVERSRVDEVIDQSIRSLRLMLSGR